MLSGIFLQKKILFETKKSIKKLDAELSDNDRFI
jgi:hypothetical protein